MAGAQQGVISREQLLAAGIGAGAIQHRLTNGRLHRTSFSGIYLWGHKALAPHAREMAAILAFRGYAVISHASAAAMWDLVEKEGPLHLTSFGSHRRQRPHLTVHRVPALDNRDIGYRHGVPVTAPARTLIDLAATAIEDELALALGQARARRLVTDAKLRASISRCPTRAGVGALKALLEDPYERGFDQSEAERLLRSLVRSAGLPPPETQVTLFGYRVDFLWPARRLVVEIDSHRFHANRAAFERDRERDQVLTAHGYRVIRVTWRQLTREPVAVAVRIAQALNA